MENKFGTRIKDLRMENKITQRELARKIDVDFSYISKMENNRLSNAPSYQTVHKIAMALNTNEEELLLLAKKIPQNLETTMLSDQLAVRFLRKVSCLNSEERQKVEDILSEGEKRGSDIHHSK